ncbi:protoglobin protein [Ceratobasidium sp. AG-Ba]|nr:protoglobin protein [Ceratobasidium sp. AG-Ba]QRV93393.1 protoglobin protein [Ceratobasidium sp. AG-Ba]
MQHIDAQEIENSLPARVDYLAKFIEFGPKDAAALHTAAPIVKDLIAGAVDAVYEKLFTFDITRASFMERNTGFQGKVATRLEDITHNSEQIQFRKNFLRQYVAKVFTADYSNPKTFEYFDKVGIMHTGQAGFKHREKSSRLHVDCK